MSKYLTSTVALRKEEFKYHNLTSTNIDVVQITITKLRIISVLLEMGI